jgi:hypothetical protein
VEMAHLFPSYIAINCFGLLAATKQRAKSSFR